MTAPVEALARLKALASEQAALRRVATLVAGNPDPSEVFAKVCAEVAAVLGVESTNLVRFESSAEAKVVGGWGANDAPVFPVGADVPLDGGTAVVKVSRSGRPERVDDYGGLRGELPERLRELGIASAVAAPIKVEGRLWGAVVASSGEPHAFPPGTEQQVAGFAELVSDALANADARQQLAASRARIVAAADHERRRLERDLHDGAQQRLVALALALREVDEELTTDVDSARRALAQAREELALALEELRELARGIHPAILCERGLGPAVEALAARAPLPVEVSVLAETRLPEAVEAAAYFLVAEGLTNVAKHAQATRASVEIARSNGRARIRVQDDGIGGASVAEGSGLHGLADRLEALGGNLVVQSAQGTGTTLVGEIPLNQDIPPERSTASRTAALRKPEPEDAG